MDRDTQIGAFRWSWRRLHHRPPKWIWRTMAIVGVGGMLSGDLYPPCLLRESVCEFVPRIPSHASWGAVVRSLVPPLIVLTGWWLVLLARAGTEQRNELLEWIQQHMASVHAELEVDFTIASESEDGRTSVSLKMHHAPAGDYAAEGRSINGEAQKPWVIPWGLDSTPDQKVMRNPTPLLNIAQVQWVDDDNVTISPVRPGKSDDDWYQLHNPHTYEGKRCDLELAVVGEGFGDRWYKLVVSASREPDGRIEFEVDCQLITQLD